MDYTSYPTKENADYYLALADVEDWLKQLEGNGGTVADLKFRIEIMQAVANKLSSNAKINLGLRIVARRPDGYHNIETVFYPVQLQDALEIVPTSQTTGMLSHG